MLLVTNFRNFPPRWKSTSGQEGRSVHAATLAEFLRYRQEAGAVYLINGDIRLTLALAARSLVSSLPRIVAVDLVMRKPEGWRAAQLPFKRFLFRRVALFIHYFRDLRGYSAVFGIGAERSAFVPFKVNLAGRGLQPSAEGEYVLCFGRSMRDFDTFFEAMEKLPYPAAIARPDLAQLRRHLARFRRPLEALPPTMQLLEDDGSDEAQIRILTGAKLVVLPILKDSMVASGIGTCLNALALGKCVLVSEGPGATDVFTDGEVLFAPPEDAAALAALIQRAWENEPLRRETARKGYAYAQQAGGEAELYRRVIDTVLSRSEGRPGEPGDRCYDRA